MFESRMPSAMTSGPDILEILPVLMVALAFPAGWPARMMMMTLMEDGF